MPLRCLDEADLLLILNWRNAPEVRNNMFSTREITEQEHRDWFARTKADPQSHFYVREDRDGVPNGVVYFTQCRPETQSSFWGFYAAPHSRPGTGTLLGMEALDEAFGPLKLHKVNAEVLAMNERSLGLHRKLGFTQEGLFRDFHFDGTRFMDVVRFGILAPEWHARRVNLA
ncbi:MAG TPA: UDP-4-amino-4,6-dideoxy-N-acetyl-beta-L-altrosamine N-acetyltransferase [Ramlibacter sp.]|jgi:UDP-4-amino-4,6-dideoxy-N-acetyl-beta-L-altrosamine N-acetyltransferase